MEGQIIAPDLDRRCREQRRELRERGFLRNDDMTLRAFGIGDAAFLQIDPPGKAGAKCSSSAMLIGL